MTVCTKIYQNTYITLKLQILHILMHMRYGIHSFNGCIWGVVFLISLAPKLISILSITYSGVMGNKYLVTIVFILTFKIVSYVWEITLDKW